MSFSMRQRDIAKMIAECVHCAQNYDEHDYLYHLQKVVDTLVKFGFGDDEELVCAAWLHDSVEDTQLKISVIEKYFGKGVAALVYAVTNEIGQNRKERSQKTYLKLSGNGRATMLKVADRIANVENALEKENLRFFEMYKEEYGVFRYALRPALLTPDANRMWDHLDTLMKWNER